MTEYAVLYRIFLFSQKCEECVEITRLVQFGSSALVMFSVL